MSAAALQQQARLAERESNYDKAKELYQEIIEKYPDSTEATAAVVDLDEIKAKESIPPAPQKESNDVAEAVIQGGDVSVIDIKMPFWSMVGFMVKASLASIPAVIILTIIAFVAASALGGLGGITQ